MATKHIPDGIWRKVEQEAVKAVITTRTGIKDTDVHNYLLLKYIDTLTEDDFWEMAKKKNKTK